MNILWIKDNPSNTSIISVLNSKYEFVHLKYLSPKGFTEDDFVRAGMLLIEKHHMINISGIFYLESDELYKGVKVRGYQNILTDIDNSVWWFIDN